MPEQLLDQLNTNKDMQIDLQELQKAVANKFFENKNNRDQLSYELNQGINSLLEESFCQALTLAYLEAKKRVGVAKETSVVMQGSPQDRALLQLFHELSTYNNYLLHLQNTLEQKKTATDATYKELQEGKVGTEKWMDMQVRLFESHRQFTRGTYDQKKTLLITACKTTDADSRLTPVQKEHLKERYLLTLMTKKNGELTLFGIKDRVQKQRVSYEQLTKQLHTAQQQFEADCSPEDINTIALYQNASGEELKFRPVLTEKQRNLMHQLNAMQQQEHQLDAVQQYFSHIMQLPDSDQGTPWKNFQAGRERQIPFVSGIMEVGKLIDIYQIAKKQQAGGQLSATEQLLFQSFASLEQARTAVAQMKITGYDVGAGASSTVNFLVELGLTGGMIGLGRKAAVEGSKKIVKQMVKKETRKVALETVKKGTKEAAKIGIKMTSTIQAHNTARNVMEELVADYGLKLDPDGQVNIAEYGPGASIIKGLIKGVAKSFITNTSEQVGGPIVNELFGYLPKSVMSNWIINVLQTGQMKKILQDGFVGESLEEFISQGLTGVHDVARGDTKLSEIYSLHGAKVTVLTCMLISGGVQGLNITNNTLRFTDNGQTKIIDLGTHENITQLTPGQEQKTESYIKQKWQEALVENKALVTNIKQQLNIIRQDYASEVRKQNSPEGIRSRQNFQEFWKNMSKLGITGIATRIPPLAFIPGSQVAILYMSQNQKNIKKFLGLTFHALDEIEKANVEKKQIQTPTPKTPDQTTFISETPTPQEIEEVQAYVAEVNQDIKELDQAIQKDDVVAIQHALDDWHQEVTQTKQSLFKGKVSALRAVARQEAMIRHGEHLVHALMHASGKIREIFFTKGTLHEKLATTLTLTGEVIGILYHGGHLAHVVAHPDPQGYLSLSHLSTETVLIDSFTHKLESFGKSMLMWATQRKAYAELQTMTPGLLEQLETASPIRREKLREIISDKLFKLQFQESYKIVDETLMRLVNNPTKEDIAQLEAIIAVLNPNRLEHVKLLWSYSSTMASKKIGKTMQKYTPEMDGIY